MTDVNKLKGIVFSFISAFLYGLNVPISKLFIDKIFPNEMLFLLYFGNVIVMFFIILFNKKETFKFNRKEMPSIVGIVLSEVITSLLLIKALQSLNASTVSLLSILETSATVILSIFIFKSKLSKKLILSVIFVTIGSIILSFNDINNFNISFSILLVLIVTFIWGLENNLTEKISNTKSLPLVFYKCLSVSLFSFILILGKSNIIDLILNYWYLIIFGFTYGISILFFAYGTKYIGASKTAIIFSFSPIFSTFLSFIIFKDNISILFIISFIFMLFGIYFTILDKK